MTYTLVSAGTVATATTAALTVTCTSTTQHNLLVACVGAISGSRLTFTLPAGWIQAAASPTGSICQTQIWYYPDCPAGITSVLVTLSQSATPAAQILQYNDSAGTNATPLDVIGTVALGSGVAPPLAVSTSAAAPAHDLAVCSSTMNFSSATKDTLSPGAGFTQAGNYGNAIKQTDHMGFDYQLDCAAGVVTDSVSWTVSGVSFGGAIATFAPFTVAPAGLLPQQVQVRHPVEIHKRNRAISGWRA